MQSPFAALLFYGLTRGHFQAAKSRYGLRAWTQIHHIVPRELRHHPCVRSRVDIDDGCNLMLMPNREGKRKLRTSRPVHDGGHRMYNRRVGAELDRILRAHRGGDVRARDAEVAALMRRPRADVCAARGPWT